MEKKHGTKIQWTQAPGYNGETWNPTVGCSKVSAGCANCYAIKDQHRMAGNPNRKVSDRASGLTKSTPHGLDWTGKVNFIEERLEQPQRWAKPRMIFVNSQSDLFHESITDEQLDQIFAVMALTPRHIYQVLTKRPDRMLRYFGGCDRTLPNVWLGVTVENQKAADERIPLLLQTPAAVRFLSCEPLLEEVEISQVTEETGDDYGDGAVYLHPLTGDRWMRDGFEKELNNYSRLDWVIVGGESGPKARVCDIDWISSIVKQCQSADVPAFVKQLGSKPVDGSGWPIEGVTGKGGNPDEWNEVEDLRVREWPRVLTATGNP